MPFFPVAM